MYQQRLENLQSRREHPQRPTVQRQYRDAPPPNRNFWNRQPQNRTGQPPSQQDMQHYPELPTRPTTNRQAPGAQASNNVNSTTQTSDIIETHQLFTELDSLINVKEMNRAVRALIHQLKQGNTPQGRFTTYYEFMINLGKNFNV